MDLNLTQPILFNGTLNATLIQSPDPWYKDWFPAIVSLFVVILGGLITYHVTINVERDKRQYELKKQVYMDIIDWVLKFERNREKFGLRVLESKDVPVSEAVSEAFIEYQNMIRPQLKLLGMQLLLCGGSLEVYESITKAHDELNYVAEEETLYSTDELIFLMKQDLEKSKKWYQFSKKLPKYSPTEVQVELKHWDTVAELENKHWWQFWRRD
jgi:hypothetical protein